MHLDFSHSAGQAINNGYLADEAILIKELLRQLTHYQAAGVMDHARHLLMQVRAKRNQSRHSVKQSVIQAFLHEYQLNSDEGIVLMNIAEALLRIPDHATQDRFLADRIIAADWHQHLGHSNSLLVNLASDALALSGSLKQHQRQFQSNHPVSFQSMFENLLVRLGQPVIRAALKQAMFLLSEQFVMAETIEDAVNKSIAVSETESRSGIRYSFDMLGEAAITAADADRFFNAYMHAIGQLATKVQAGNDNDNYDLYIRPSVSVKLSALYPRYEPLQHRHAVPELTAKLLKLAQYARAGGISLTVDAEESERLEMSLDIFEAVFVHEKLDGWSGLGLAVQAYQKRATYVIQWLAKLAKNKQRKISVRLVKGAYWDSEIKRAQENGLTGYPVFTRKSATDISYLVCARLLISKPDCFYPQFATHNAHTVAAILQMVRNHSNYEFQRLYGMGKALYQAVLEQYNHSVVCRVYAPVGCYQDLLPYLVRRLLENGANTSFIHQIENPDIAVEDVVCDPVTTWQDGTPMGLSLPEALYGEHRRNSQGCNLADSRVRRQFQQNLAELAYKQHQAVPLISGTAYTGRTQAIIAPYDRSEVVGEVVNSNPQAIVDALDAAASAFNDWRLYLVEQRAGCLFKAADLMEQQRMELVALSVREGGRTIKDALAEVREAVDFCRYYAVSALELFRYPINLPGPTGEENNLRYYGRGIFVCISPWNFPIAIFVGQVAAALAAGNTVIAKPAESTTLTAMACVRILHQAGIPESVLQFLPGKGSEIGSQLLQDSRIAGVAFTGSTATAHRINRELAGHPVIVPFVAETGGQNFMIADTSAHKEQLVQDVILSAFNSAGQRCSALRVLFLPEETADKIVELVVGAIQQLRIGNPGDYATDIGPVINRAALERLEQHVEHMRTHGNVIFQLPPFVDATGCYKGNYFSPTLIEINDLKYLQEEVFGPILHVIRYSSSNLDAVIDTVNATGYGLTLGIHSRIQSTINKIQQQVRVGNIYINRNMIGAVVGVQPFGGMGLSGTGPKAGGPDYLRRFAVEQTVTNNIAAIGGNTGLLAQDLR
ncbi:L-proline dehydrogenase /delta-1-pyrroline-5-carboxylate dehydrogenase [Nitrosomonas aestuarii]|uniref:Bifunctional protein PutA n=1 Tax=Nitrosomonas aestuarii TaxID=52441 RepID=A0A1I4DYL6_9PROT|nr:bifunctional proline dehydrogenase/L-glutamate gamma-semialdehyde dehydrogenase PutA [Nitrosomonas aestuarii]SFK96991.1 L-proline dehydrogenase /delta-1-pyrroline-5-carboxylate dehydrogenase [Nitrosomonas aestuarii]